MMDPALWELYEGNSEDEVSAIIRLNNPEISPEGVRIVSQFGEIATCRFRRGEISRVRSDENVRSLKAPRGLTNTIYNEEASGYTLSDEVYPVKRPAVSETGRGVVMGIIDWGCDFAHPDFMTPEGETRLSSIWLQKGVSNVTDDNPYGRGRIIFREEINQALTTDYPYETLDYHPGEVAAEGGSHGTHTMGIAAGNGLGSGLSGIAPDAELIFVQADSSGLSGLANFGDSVALLEAVDFILKQAGDQPCVINMSMGRHGGPHDGTTLVELGLDEALRATPGIAFVNSTGNYFGANAHASGKLKSNQLHSLEWIVDPADRTSNELEIWYSGEDRFNVKLISPEGDEFGPVLVDEQADVMEDDKRVGRIYHRALDPNNGKNHIDIFLYRDSPVGVWSVELDAEEIHDGHFNAWIERDGGRRENQSRFAREDAVTTGTTGTIANGQLTIAVGAYDARDSRRKIAPFSSSGPTSDNRQKPELVAPGVRVLAAASAPLEMENPPLLTAKSGTSMAAPHVAGTLALLFEASPKKLKIHETRNFLLSSVDETLAITDEPFRLGKGFLNSASVLTKVHQDNSVIKQPGQHLAEKGNAHFEMEKTMDTQEHLDSYEPITPMEKIETLTFLDDRVSDLPSAEDPSLFIDDRNRDDGETGANRRLRAGEVKYLVLEGGGGKGLIFPGALKALQSIRRGAGAEGNIISYQNHRLQHIEGVAGSSAGAMTAMALSLGMNAREIEGITDPRHKDFDELFDMPSVPRKVPILGQTCVEASRPSRFRQNVFGPMQRIAEQFLRAAIPDFVERRLNPRDLSIALVASVEQNLLAYMTQTISEGDDISHKLFSPALLYYAQNLWEDMGLFSGCEARSFIDNTLSEHNGGRRNMTFSQHYEMFRVKLKVTGSNLETGRTGVFSVDHTPHISVADAVRISMGLPVLYKPVRINIDQSRRITRGARIRPASLQGYAGLWVDGGLWNNLPMTLFSEEENGVPATLGLALGNEAIQRTPIHGLDDFLFTLLSRFSGDEALSNRNPSYVDQVITLDTGALRTENFSPNRDVLRTLKNTAAETTRSYFS